MYTLVQLLYVIKIVHTQIVPYEFRDGIGCQGMKFKNNTAVTYIYNIVHCVSSIATKNVFCSNCVICE